ncbi:MAG TPA: metal ABC transporter substrate-binding protein [Chthoniobacteraceae bacterium]|nr:metal ABC transporter substrate-binding protein [Chthoniobacteraceae bacterium]
MKGYRLLLVLCCCFPLLLGAAEEKRLTVLTTFAPITSLTMQVAGDQAEITQFLPPGVDPHHFALSPRHLRLLAKADVLVENGLRMEEWVTGALKGTRAVRISAGQGIRTDDGNPHVWLDPILAIHQIEVIRDGLSRVDPDHADLYRNNAAAAIARLRQLDEAIRTTTAGFPDKRLMMAHNAFHYFAKRYGFQVVGVFGKAHGQEPTPRELRALRKTIGKEKIKVLFLDAEHTPRVMESLAKEFDLRLVRLDAMEMAPAAPETYVKVMEANLKALREALDGGR